MVSDAFVINVFVVGEAQSREGEEEDGLDLHDERQVCMGTNVFAASHSLHELAADLCLPSIVAKNRALRGIHPSLR